MKLSLSMICKDELANLQRLHPLVKDYIDQWVVVVPPNDPAIDFLKEVKATVVVKDFTQAIEPELIERFRDYGMDVDADYRLFNFAAARNESLSKATGDYVMWLDADDHPDGLEKLRSFVETHSAAEVFDCVYDYARDEQGNSISDQIRERVVVNNGKFTWRGAKLGLIHETLMPDEGYSPMIIQVPKDTFAVIHQSDHVDESSIRNHIALLYEYLKTDGADARTTYYLGVEYFNRGLYEYCVKIMQEYLKVGGWDEERYRAWIRMAEAYHQMGDYESSRNAYLNATKELPNYPDAYLGIGESYHASEDYEKAIEFILTGMQKPLPQTKSAVDIVKYTFRAMNFLALSYMQVGKSGEAYKWFLKAKKANPKHPWIERYQPLFEEMNDLDEYVRSFVKLGQIAQRRYPRTLGKVADIVPDELMDQDVLLAYKRKYTTPKVWPDKSIVYFCSAAFEEWGPDSLKTGCGGSEEAVIHLTKRWAEMGYDVTVFNNCPKEKTVDGVHWVRYERFNPRDIFNILISWRNNPFLESKVASKKLIDVHDVPSLKYFPEKVLKDVTLVVKSQYHRDCFPHLKDENFKIINNGIDPKQFPASDKVKNSLVWTSSYDRGLEYLLKMWPDIRDAVPDAQLNVYYGWNLYDASPRGKTKEGQTWKSLMLDLLQQEGITDHGRVNTEDIAKAYLKADVWAYPTDFPEIDCITATKAMAAKCVPVSTDVAALKERNQGVVVPGSGADPKVQEAFKVELINLLKDEERKATIRKQLDVGSFGWDSVAKRWEELFR